MPQMDGKDRAGRTANCAVLPLHQMAGDEMARGNLAQLGAGFGAALFAEAAARAERAARGRVDGRGHVALKDGCALAIGGRGRGRATGTADSSALV